MVDTKYCEYFKVNEGYAAMTQIKHEEMVKSMAEKPKPLDENEPLHPDFTLESDNEAVLKIARELGVLRKPLSMEDDLPIVNPITSKKINWPSVSLERPAEAFKDEFNH